MTVRAAVCHAFGEPLVIEEIEIAAPSRGEVEVELAACAICQSDIHYAQGAWGGTLPAVYGHEAAGVVVRGRPRRRGVRGRRPRRRDADPLVRNVRRVRPGRAGPLRRRRSRSTSTGPLRALDGTPIPQGLRTAAFAEKVVVDASQVVVDPADLPLDSAALLACGVITGFGAVVNTARLEPGSSVVVIGTGGVGLNAVQGAVLAGATTVIAVDPSEAKRRGGACRSAPPTSSIRRPTTSSTLVTRLTGGRRADYVIVTVGAEGAVEQGACCCAGAGTMVIVGMPAAGVTASIDPGTIANDGHRILGSKMGSARIAIDIPEPRRALPGRPPEARRADLRSATRSSRSTRRSRSAAAATQSAT